MKLALITDAWLPQVNGVVTTLLELRDGLEQLGHRVTMIEPSPFRRFACPGYREIELSWRPGAEVARRLDEGGFDAIHIATEGPLGSAARAHCLKRGWAFSSAFHTRFPDILAKALHIPPRWGYAWFRRFHAASASVMVPSAGLLGNLQAFLELELPGSKVVHGVGPLQARLQAEYPQAHWRGVVARAQLPRIYSAADVFVFPGRSETFGLVMLEAMACGTPVAAFPVPGPLDVVGDSAGGVLDADPRHAALRALELPRGPARARALEFDWRRVCAQFVGHLVPSRTVARTVTPLSQKLHKLRS